MSEISPENTSGDPTDSTMNEKRRSGDSSSVVERPAGFGRRWVAFVVDNILHGFCQLPTFVFLWIFIGGTLVSIGKNIRMGADPQSLITGGTVLLVVAGFFISSIIAMVISTLYYGWFNRNKGGSPGKLFMDLRIKDDTTGGNLTYGQSFLRDVFWKSGVPSLVGLALMAFALMLQLPPMIADAFNGVFGLVFLLGYLMAAVRKDKRAFHDLVFGTRVVHRLVMRG